MALIKLSPAFEEIRGRLNNVTFRRYRKSGRLQMIRIADMSEVKWSPAQKKQRERFAKAIAYAKAAMAQPKVRAHYEKAAEELNKRPFDLAVSDYFKDRNLLEK